MRIFFSTVVRGAPLKQGGEFVRLDWTGKKVEAAVAIYPTNPALDDPNPRGNARGGKGIALLDNNEVAVASYHTLKVYDANLRHQRDISHPLAVGLHEVHRNGDKRIWVSATAIDAALEIDMATGGVVRELWPREMPGFQSALGLTPLEIDKSADNRGRFLGRDHLEHPSHLHLNAVYSWRGDTYALFHAFGAIANLDKQEVVIRDPALRGGHNLIIAEDGTAFANDSNGHAVRMYDLNDRKLVSVIDLTSFGWVRALLRRHKLTSMAKKALSLTNGRKQVIARPLFVRGLDRVGDMVFVGLSPASILCIDANRQELIDAYCYSHDVHVSMHGLKVQTT